MGRPSSGNQKAGLDGNLQENISVCVSLFLPLPFITYRQFWVRQHGEDWSCEVKQGQSSLTMTNKVIRWKWFPTVEGKITDVKNKGNINSLGAPSNISIHWLFSSSIYLLPQILVNTYLLCSSRLDYIKIGKLQFLPSTNLVYNLPRNNTSKHDSIYEVLKIYMQNEVFMRHR